MRGLGVQQALKWVGGLRGLGVCLVGAVLEPAWPGGGEAWRRFEIPTDPAKTAPAIGGGGY